MKSEEESSTGRELMLRTVGPLSIYQEHQNINECDRHFNECLLQDTKSVREKPCQTSEGSCAKPYAFVS